MAKKVKAHRRKNKPVRRYVRREARGVVVWTKRNAKRTAQGTVEWGGLADKWANKRAKNTDSWVRRNF